MYRLCPFFIPLALLLAACLGPIGCASVVQIRPPYEKKVRIGDVVHATVEDKIIHGSVVYADRKGLVIKTGKTVKQEHPVKAYSFTTQINWSEIQNLQVDGILDPQGKLISEEEIKVNKRTNFRKSLMLNTAIIGFGASFGLGVLIQDQVYPPLGGKPISKLNDGRGAFWMTWIAGTLISTLGGYAVGGHIDRQRAIDRVVQMRRIDEQIESISGARSRRETRDGKRQ